MRGKAHVSENKKKLVNEIVGLIKKSPIIGIANLTGLPAPQLQKMRALLRNKVKMRMIKKTLTRIALTQASKEKKGLEKLSEYLQGSPALIFTEENPFSLYKIVKKNRSAAPAKGGDIAPKNIVIPVGPTPFTPGPVISELKSLGVNATIENAKVVVKQEAVVCKEGEVINEQLASMLARLGIEPMEVGLDIIAVYENGLIYDKKVLDIDEEKFLQDLNKAIIHACNLSVEIVYPTKQNIELLITKAFSQSKNLALAEGILAVGIINEVLAKAHAQMLSLKNQINFNGG